MANIGNKRLFRLIKVWYGTHVDILKLNIEIKSESRILNQIKYNHNVDITLKNAINVLLQIYTGLLKYR
jgi:hypothetical protein